MSFIDGKEEQVDGGGVVDPWNAEVIAKIARDLGSIDWRGLATDARLCRLPYQEGYRDPQRAAAEFRELVADRLIDRDGRVEGVDR